MSTTTEKLVTEFSALGGPAYQRTLSTIGRTAQTAGGMIERMTRHINPLNVALGALGGGYALAKIIGVGEAFENVQAKLAGTLADMKVAPSFVEGLTQADAVLNSINTAAAALPGEAQDYISVFTTTLPVLSRAVGGNMKQMTDFSNQYTAVMSGLGISSIEAGMMLNRALTPGRGTLDSMAQSSNTFINKLKNVEGQANLTLQTFNRMDEHARAALVQKMLSGQGDMLKYVSDKWSAVAGSVKSTQKLMMRLATASLFEGMTKALARINSAFVDSNGQLTKLGTLVVEIGKFFGDHVARGMDSMSRKFEKFAQNIDKWLAGMQNSPFIKVLDSILTKAGALGRALTSGGGKGGGGAAGPSTMQMSAGAAVMGLMAGPVAALAGFVLGIDNVVAIFTRLGEGVGLLYDSLQPVVSTMGGALAGVLLSIVDIALALIPAFVGVAEIVFVLIDALAPFVGAIITVASFLVGLLAPAVKAIGDGFVYWKGLIEPVVQVLTALFAGMAVVVGLLLIPFSPLIVAVGALVAAFAAAIAFFNSNKYDVSTTRGTGGAEGPASGVMAELAAKLKDFQSKQAADLTKMVAPELAGAKPPRAPGARGGSKTVQDFRNSRFSIQQEFAEGFDPDRIAVAFSKDLGKLGEQRLQSGQEPLFGGGR